MAARNPSTNPQCSGEFTEYAGNSDPITLAAWYRNTGGYQAISNGITPICAINNQQSSTGSRILLAVSGSSSIPATKVFIFDVLSTPLSGNYLPTGTPADTSWHHLCGVVTSATNRKFYQDGIEVRSNISSVTINSSIMCSILSLYQSNTWTGNFSQSSEIADIGVWNTNLTSGEVYSLSKGFTCDKIRPQSLVLYMPMMSGQYLQDIMKNRAFISGNFLATSLSFLPTAPALY